MKATWTDFALRYFTPLFSLLLIFTFCAVTLAADNGVPPPPSNAPPELNSTGGEHARLVVDDATGSVTIIIEGREVGRFDKDGLHVVGDIDYTGSISDTVATWLETPKSGGTPDAE